MSKKKIPQGKKEAEYKREAMLPWSNAEGTRKIVRRKKRPARKKMRSRTFKLTRPAQGLDGDAAVVELEDVTLAFLKTGIAKKKQQLLTA